MKKIFGLDEWKLDKAYGNDKRIAKVKIVLAYPFPDQKVLLDLKPKARIKKINNAFDDSLKLLLSYNLIEDWESIDSVKRVRSLRAKIKYSNLKKLSKLDFIGSIWISSIEHAVKIEKAPVAVEKYYCVKMTVVVEIESFAPKKQDIEKRYVIIKAMSFEDAYEKIENQKENYVEPYLNSDGRFVRWRIDSFDDCYETDIAKPADLNRVEGIEIFSASKTRKNKTEKAWDGKF